MISFVLNFKEVSVFCKCNFLKHGNTSQQNFTFTKWKLFTAIICYYIRKQKTLVTHWYPYGNVLHALLPSSGSKFLQSIPRQNVYEFSSRSTPRYMVSHLLVIVYLQCAFRCCLKQKHISVIVTKNVEEKLC